jgi:fructokinase
VRYGGLEAGGTKWVCGVGPGNGTLDAGETFPTTTPGETLDRAASFFEREGPVEALGIGCFGPVDLAAGRITTTPKPGWADAEVVAPLRERLGVPVAFDTDVNAAAVGEHRYGAARGLDTFAYVTVGTGIGGGAIAGGEVIHGLTHPELGHLRVPRVAGDDFPGVCPYHGDCFEGLASGPALAVRWGRPAEQLAGDERVWELEAEYVALGLVALVAVLSPELVVLGGGVGTAEGLLPRVERKLGELLGGYVRAPSVVAPALGSESGVLGAIALSAAA